MNKLIYSLAITGALAVSSMVSAAVAPYSQDFEGLTQSDPDALSNNGWQFFGAAFDNGAFQYGYGPFPAPNNQTQPNISTIADNEGDVDQGVQQVNIFSDYENPDQCDGAKLYEIEANVYQEQTISSSDIGDTWVLRFDVKKGNLSGTTTAQAFIKTIAGSDQTNLVSLDVTAFPTTWTNTQEISLFLDATDDVNNGTGLAPGDGIPDLVGQKIQFGFSSLTECAVDSGMFYDNVEWFQGAGTAAILPYSQDFEGLVKSDPAALSNDGWQFFGAAFDNGAFQYGYGPFPAPNNQDQPNISTIADNEGDVDQGVQQVNIFSDYENGDQCDGAKLYEIEANVYQEQVINSSDIDDTWVLRFDVKKGNLSGTTTAQAFIKTIAGSDQTNLVSLDVTAFPTTWTNMQEISLFLDATDDVNNDTGLAPGDGIPDLVGQKIQFGFSSLTECAVDSGMFYDNVEWFKGGAGCVGNGTDTDSDGIDDNCDNCTFVANGPNTYPLPEDAHLIQRDIDEDGFGSICDADLDQTCQVSTGDLNILGANFFGSDPNSDLDGSGQVSTGDLNIMSATFFGLPGPSGLASCD